MRKKCKINITILVLGIFFATSAVSNQIFNDNQENNNLSIEIRNETNFKTANSEINIITPENKTYTKPMNGHYPATYGFENDKDGSVPYGWTGSEANIIESEGDHKKVIELDNIGNNIYSADNTFNQQEHGTIEFWIRTNNALNPPSRIRLLNSSDIGPDTRIFWNKWQYRVDTTWNDMLQENSVDPMPAPSNNTWMHVKIEFEC